MRALLLTDYRHLELVDMPVPEIGPDDVLVRVRACGICGSDVLVDGGISAGATRATVAR